MEIFKQNYLTKKLKIREKIENQRFRTNRDKSGNRLKMSKVFNLPNIYVKIMF